MGSKLKFKLTEKQARAVVELLEDEFIYGESTVARKKVLFKALSKINNALIDAGLPAGIDVDKWMK